MDDHEPRFLNRNAHWPLDRVADLEPLAHHLRRPVPPGRSVEVAGQEHRDALSPKAFSGLEGRLDGRESQPALQCEHGALGLALLDLEGAVWVRGQVDVLDGHHLPRRELNEEVDAVRPGGVDQRVLRQDLEPTARVRPSKGALKCQGVALGLLDGDHVGAAPADRLHDLVEADVDPSVLDVELKDLELKRSNRPHLRRCRLCVQAQRECREQP